MSTLLPIDVVNYILELSGYHKWRYGKYMRQLSQTNILVWKPEIETRRYFEDTEYTAYFSATHNQRLYEFFITTEIFMGRVHWFLDVFDAQTYKLARKKCLHYVFNNKSKKHRPKIAKASPPPRLHVQRLVDDNIL